MQTNTSRLFVECYAKASGFRLFPCLHLQPHCCSRPVLVTAAASLGLLPLPARNSCPHLPCSHTTTFFYSTPVLRSGSIVSPDSYSRGVLSQRCPLTIGWLALCSEDLFTCQFPTLDLEPPWGQGSEVSSDCQTESKDVINVWWINEWTNKCNFYVQFNSTYIYWALTLCQALFLVFGILYE